MIKKINCRLFIYESVDQLYFEQKINAVNQITLTG